MADPSSNPSPATSAPDPGQSYTLRAMTPADLPTHAALWNATMGSGEFHSAFFPGRLSYPLAYALFSLRLSRARLADPRARYILAVHRSPTTEHEELVGIGCFIAGAGSELARRWERERWAETGWAGWVERVLRRCEEGYWGWFGDRGMDREAVAGFRADSARALEGLGAHVHIPTVVVAEGHRRRGVAGLLLNWGLEVARREGLPVSLESSKLGKGVYEAWGFKVVGEVVVGKGEGAVRAPVMVWEPEAERGRWLLEEGERWRIRSIEEQEEWLERRGRRSGLGA